MLSTLPGQAAGGSRAPAEGCLAAGVTVGATALTRLRARRLLRGDSSWLRFTDLRLQLPGRPLRRCCRREVDCCSRRSQGTGGLCQTRWGAGALKGLLWGQQGPCSGGSQRRGAGAGAGAGGPGGCGERHTVPRTRLLLRPPLRCCVGICASGCTHTYPLLTGTRQCHCSRTFNMCLYFSPRYAISVGFLTMKYVSREEKQEGPSSADAPG